MERLCIRYDVPFQVISDPPSPPHHLKPHDLTPQTNTPQCVDITFADPKDVAEVNSSNCFNSSDISFANVYTINDASSPGSAKSSSSGTGSSATGSSSAATSVTALSMGKGWRSVWSGSVVAFLGCAAWGLL